MSTDAQGRAVERLMTGDSGVEPYPNPGHGRPTGGQTRRSPPTKGPELRVGDKALLGPWECEISRKIANQEECTEGISNTRRMWMTSSRVLG